jgi:hypothetical protein
MNLWAFWMSFRETFKPLVPTNKFQRNLLVFMPHFKVPEENLGLQAFQISFNETYWHLVPINKFQRNFWDGDSAPVKRA